MEQLSAIGAHWWWLTAAALLAIFEIFAPGVFLVWMAAAAAITGVAVLLLGIPLAAQIALFVLLAICAVYGGRRHYSRNPVESSDPLLNDRAARLIGETLTVVDAIEGGEGRVKVGDSVWAARGADAPAGARVVVTGVQGTCLQVRLSPQQPQLPDETPAS